MDDRLTSSSSSRVSFRRRADRRVLSFFGPSGSLHS